MLLFIHIEQNEYDVEVSSCLFYLLTICRLSQYVLFCYNYFFCDA